MATEIKKKQKRRLNKRGRSGYGTDDSERRYDEKGDWRETTYRVEAWNLPRGRDGWER